MICSLLSFHFKFELQTNNFITEKLFVENLAMLKFDLYRILFEQTNSKADIKNTRNSSLYSPFYERTNAFFLTSIADQKS